jgi:hypothetical protein
MAAAIADVGSRNPEARGLSILKYTIRLTIAIAIEI